GSRITAPVRRPAMSSPSWTVRSTSSSMPTSEPSGASEGKRVRRVRKKRRSRGHSLDASVSGSGGWLLPLLGGIVVAVLAFFLLFGDAFNHPPGQVAGPAPAAKPADPAARVVPASAFDGDRAFTDLKKQVEFGPRVPAMPGHDKCRDFLVSTLKPLADSVERQDFTQKVRGKSLPMTNVIARWKGKG